MVMALSWGDGAHRLDAGQVVCQHVVGLPGRDHGGGQEAGIAAPANITGKRRFGENGGQSPRQRRGLKSQTQGQP